jgi:hypothetical protein
MTRDEPDIASLLETARAVLRDELLPLAPPGKTLDLLMIVKVLELAARALADASDGLEERQRARIGQLTGAGGDAASLAAQIRGGLWDAPRKAALIHRVLTEDAHDRLARLNPKYLDALMNES